MKGDVVTGFCAALENASPTKKSRDVIVESESAEHASKNREKLRAKGVIPAGEAIQISAAVTSAGRDILGPPV